jgi:archaellum component FlaF (FlaF/FlaG flagellin family)
LRFVSNILRLKVGGFAQTAENLSTTTRIQLTRTRRNLTTATAAIFIFAASALAQPPAPAGPVYANPPAQYGPYNGVFLPDGLGLTITIPDAKDTILDADTPWAMLCWINTPEPVTAPEIVTSLGSLSAEYARTLRIESNKLALALGDANEISGPADLTPNAWHLLTATFDGQKFSLYADGKPIAAGPLALGSTNGTLLLAPIFTGKQHFGGRIANFTLLRHSLTTDEVASIYKSPPDFATVEFEEGSKPWVIQTRGQAGYRAPQEPATMPQQRGSFSPPVAIARPTVGKSLTQLDPNDWAFTDGWTLIEAPKIPIEFNDSQISLPTFPAANWLRATVPGTVLTTLVDDGVYPDPCYGLNNLAIPESLNKQDYWYRNTFDLPTSLANQQLTLDFEGINYHASIWLNGAHLGDITGAFQRGQFDATQLLKPGRNVLAVRISPPPHPGIPQEQSILGGPGENGGAMVLDGPTFVATEGWDWIPAIRDRDSGIWQPVILRATHRLKLGDAQVVTTFPNHDTSTAKLDISVPITNLSTQPTQATINASIKSIAIHKTITLPPGETIVKLTASEFPQLLMPHPRLWWPNGYGKPELYHLQLSVADGPAASDNKDIRFGVREITYELSLFDPTGHLRRVEYSPADGDVSTQPILNVSHDGMREAAAPEPAILNLPEAMRDRARTFVSTLTPAAATSPTIQPSADLGPAPYLVIKVNGVRIAARGGNWGMDDARKRVSRERLEPYFRLNRDANLNIIRNWVGQSTEETFYELADEYGMMVWNDFWESTENYNIEAQDPALFLANAADTIRRFRNHPSIVVWCGRNEGVPQPIINDGLDSLVRTLDGTRYYSPSSNALNLQGSGPYRYQQPSLYSTTLNRGFSVETGTPSMSTLESFKSTTPKEDQWPIDDVWAYHDWHHAGNGDTAPFMAEIQTEFGAPTSLEDFERKAQMLNYVSHRAVFEGMDANLWSPNSGRLLWMTQPAWPSTMWQILSSDYDTQASYYGVKKACEPIHIQLNLATNQVQLVNTTTESHTALTVSARVYSLSNELVSQSTEQKDLPADATTNSLRLDLGPEYAHGTVIVALELKDPQGTTLSQNLYWLAARPESYRELTRLPATPIQLTATSTRTGNEAHIEVHLTNSGSAVSLENKLTLLASDGSRILPAYYSDNYISLLPNESRTITINYPTAASQGPATLSLRGWNSIPQTAPVATKR